MIKIVRDINSKVETIGQAVNKYFLNRFILYKEDKKYQIMKRSEFIYQLMHYRTNELEPGSEAGPTLKEALGTYIDLGYEVYVNDKDLL